MGRSVAGSGRGRALALAFVLAVAAVGWLALGGTGPTAGPPGAPSTARSPVIADAGHRPSEATPNEVGSPTRAIEDGEGDRARRDALRDRIIEAIARNDRGEHAGVADASEPEPSRDGPTAHGPSLHDRIGGRDALVAALGDDWMPLARECIDHAVERDPTLAGMLAIEVKVVGDVELGSVIDAVDFPMDRNEVHDVELLECVRESTLSAILPAPDEGGSEAFLLTLPVDPPEPR